jgi:hypothetical protein
MCYLGMHTQENLEIGGVAALDGSKTKDKDA